MACWGIMEHAEKMLKLQQRIAMASEVMGVLPFSPVKMIITKTEGLAN